MSTTEIQPQRAHARDMTDEEREAWAEWAHKVQARVINAILSGRAAWWDMAEALYEFEDDGGWKALGFESLNEWLAQEDVGLTRTTYYKAIEQWRELHVMLKVPAPGLKVLEPSKVQEILPSVKKGTVLLKEALADAEELGWRDLKDKYRPSKPKNATTPTPPAAPSNGTVVDTPGVTGDMVADGNVASNGASANGHVATVEGKGLFEPTGPDFDDIVPPAAESPSEPEDIEGSAQDVEDENAAQAPAPQATGPDPLRVAAEALAEAFLALPERARTKHLPKPVREAIIALVDALEL